MTVHLPNADLDAALADAEARYVAANPQSQARHLAARASLPGGNTRSVMWYSPFPVALAGGSGARVRDIDGHDYADFVSEYSAGLYGHTNKVISDRIVEVVRDGIALGGPNRYEAALGAELVSRFPALDLVRFTNSGTEANIMAISTARAVTGRRRVVAFREGYHGGVLTFAHGGSRPEPALSLADGRLQRCRRHRGAAARASRMTSPASSSNRCWAAAAASAPATNFWQCCAG